MTPASPLLKTAWATSVLFQAFAIPLRDKRPSGRFRWSEYVDTPPSWGVMMGLPWREATQYGLLLPGHIAVIDLDADETGTLDTAFRTLAEWPALKAAVNANPYYVTTAGGGRHYYFDADSIEINNGPLGPSVDCKTRGGYVVGPGSPGYRWHKKPADLTDLPILPFFPAFGSIH